MASETIGWLNVTLGATVAPFTAAMRTAVDATKTMDKAIKGFNGSMALANQASMLFGSGTSVLASKLSGAFFAINQMASGLRGLDKSLRSVTLAVTAGAGLAAIGFIADRIAGHFSRAAQKADEFKRKLESLSDRGGALREKLPMLAAEANVERARVSGDRRSIVEAEFAQSRTQVESELDATQRQANEITNAITRLKKEMDPTFFEEFKGNLGFDSAYLARLEKSREQVAGLERDLAGVHSRQALLRTDYETAGLRADAERKKIAEDLFDPEQSDLKRAAARQLRITEERDFVRKLDAEREKEFRKTSVLTRFSELQRKMVDRTEAADPVLRSGTVRFGAIGDAERLSRGTVFGEQAVQPMRETNSLLGRIVQFAREQRDYLRVLATSGGTTAP